MNQFFVLEIFFRFTGDVFTSGPTKSSTSDVTINGCQYGHYLNLTSYWLLNGSLLHFNNPCESSSGGKVKTTPSYTIKSYEEFGFFKCALILEGNRSTTESEEGLQVSSEDLPGIQNVTTALPLLQLFTSTLPH